MSAGREVGGVRPTCGRRERNGSSDHPPTKAEIEQIRTGFHDFLRSHGKSVRPPKVHSRRAKPPRRTRRTPFTWQQAFLRSLVRTGEKRSAARLCGVSYATVKTSFSRQKDFRQRCLDALSEHAGRMLMRVAAGDRRTRKGQRGNRTWEVTPRSAKSLLRYFEKRMQQMAMGGIED